MSFPENAQPRTILVPGGGTTLSYELPPGVILKVESIVAEINTVAAQPRPLLTILTPEGVIVTAKRQGEDATLGGIVVATWALRLPDEGAGTAGDTLIAASVRRTTQSITTGVQTPVSFTIEEWDTDGMFDAGAPTLLTVQTAGLYAFWANVSWVTVAETSAYRAALVVLGGGATNVNPTPGQSAFSAGSSGASPFHAIYGELPMEVGHTFRLDVVHLSAASRSVHARLACRRIGDAP